MKTLYQKIIIFLKLTINPTWIERRDNLLKGGNTDKNKQVPNITPHCCVSLETFTPNLNVEIGRGSVINKWLLLD